MDDTRAQQHFFNELEQGIKLANRECIHGLIPEVSRDTILSMAVAVARLRARYLEAACGLGSATEGTLPDESRMTELRKRREMFEEGRTAYEALRYAIERGYMEVADLKDPNEVEI